MLIGCVKYYLLILSPLPPEYGLLERFVLGSPLAKETDLPDIPQTSKYFA